jgi:putative oxidoreductase
MLHAIVSTQADFVALVARLALALVILPHGLQKVFGWFGGAGIAGTLKGFRSIGIPTPFGALAIAAEFLGPFGLAFGLLGRVAALGIASVMLTAAVKVHTPNGFFMNWFGQQKGEGYEFHLLALGLATIILITGSGALSLDLALAGH